MASSSSISNREGTGSFWPMEAVHSTCGDDLTVPLPWPLCIPETGPCDRPVTVGGQAMKWPGQSFRHKQGSTARADAETPDRFHDGGAR